MSNVVLSAHQPNFMPYLGFFDKMKQSDIFVIRDEVLFVERDYHHRNRIRKNGSNGIESPQFSWLTVPVEKEQDYLGNILIKRGVSRKHGKHIFPWNQDMLHEIDVNYQKADYFKTFFPEVEMILDNSDSRLISLNMKLIEFFKKAFEIDTPIIMASSLRLKSLTYHKSDPTEDIVSLCKHLGANVYLSGSGGREYIRPEPFVRERIELKFQDYSHPKYKQNFPGFAPYMCSLDALLCTGGMPIN